MPPKPKITKEMIVDTAFNIVQKEGADKVTARSISEQLNCSTQPVLYYFSTVEDIKKAIYKKADEYHSAYIMDTEIACENPMLANDLLDVMNEFGVSPAQVNFEITETAQAHNVKELIHNMERLIESGSTFSMDDYGTGYSTTHYLIKLPLHIVKIDKSIL